MTQRLDRILDGRVLLATGAASGIGRATALLAAREGASVVVADWDQDGAERTAQQIIAEGGRAAAVRVDVSNEDDVRAMVGRTVELFGAIDCAFNNAGIGTAALGITGKKLAEIDKGAWDRTLAINLTGVFLCLKYEIEHMVASGRPGSIVNTASIAGVTGANKLSAYVATKHAVVGLTRSAAIEYGEHRIRVNALCPGRVETPMVSSAASAGQPVDANPMGRYGTPEEMAEMAVWLFSDRSSFTTGATMVNDGGTTAG